MRLPIAGGARLLEEFDSGGIDTANERDRFVRGVTLVRVHAHRRAAGNDALDRREQAQVVVDVEADLDLDGSIAVRQQTVEVFAELGVAVALQQSEDRNATRLVVAEQRVRPGHVERRVKRRCDERCTRAERLHPRARVGTRHARQFAADRRRKHVAVADRFVGVAGQERRFAEATLAAVTDDVDDDRVVMRDGPERKAIRTAQRNLEAPHVDALDPHGAAFDGSSAARRRTRNRR